MSIRNANNFLFDLVKSLSKEEKRYVKLMARAISGKEPKYLKIMDFVDAQSEYDEQEIRAQMHKQKMSVGALAGLKQQLYEFISRVLGWMQDDLGIEERILGHLRGVKLLYRRHLYEQALVALDKAEELAVGFDKFLYLPRLADWRINLHQSMSFARLNEEELEGLLARQREITAHLERVWGYRAWATRINMKRNHGYSRQVEVQAWLREQAEQVPPPIDDVAANLAYLQGRALLHSFLRDAEGTIGALEEILQFFEGRPVHLEDMDTRNIYVSTLNAILGYLAVNQPHILFERNRARAKNLPAGWLRGDQQAMFIQHELLYFLNGHEMAEALATAERLAGFMRELGPNDILAMQQGAIHFAIASALIHNGRAGEAEAHLEVAIGLREAISPQLYNTARLLYLLVFYEKGEFLLMPHSARALYRSMRKEQQLFPFERLVLNALGRLANAADKAEHKRILLIFQRKLNAILAKADAIGREPLQYFDFVFWLEGKVGG